MKKRRKWPALVLTVFILFMFFSSILGIKTTYGDKTTVYVKSAADIRWGIDIRGGVDVTFTPPTDVKATEEQMLAAEAVIKQRLIGLNITDSEVYTDTDKGRIIVRFPWKTGEKDFNPEAAIQELGETALLTFREGSEQDSNGAPSGTTKDTVILEGKDIASASPQVNQGATKESERYIVSLKLTEEGATKFAEATKRLAASSGTISIWMDNMLISAPTVNNEIPNGEAMITGNFTAQTATELANKINSGALPFKLQTENFSTISPTLGEGAKDAMLMAGVIAYVLVCAFMIFFYRLPGVVASIVLMGQITMSIIAISGYFPAFNSFTLTLPGIAGIILAIGFGVDANVITFERIKEEIRGGKSLDGSVLAGFKQAFSAIFDGNITIIIVAIILMGTFGPPDSMFAKMLSPIFFMFGPSTAGSIYSFGYTLMVGVFANLLMGVFASRVILTCLSRVKSLRKPWLYGGEKNA